MRSFPSSHIPPQSDEATPRLVGPCCTILDLTGPLGIYEDFGQVRVLRYFLLGEVDYAWLALMPLGCFGFVNPRHYGRVQRNIVRERVLGLPR